MSFEEESTHAVLISLVVSVFLALLGHATVCAEQSQCLRSGNCFSTATTTWGCSFRTNVNPTGYKMLNLSAGGNGEFLNQGVCSPGLRQQVDRDGTLRCSRAPCYPDATVTEIQRLPSGGGGGGGGGGSDSDHQRHCGKWIDASARAYGHESFGFFDEFDTERAIDELVRAKGDARLAFDDLSKFRSACRTMVTSNSAGA